MQHSVPAGWLAFTGRELHPLDRDVGFQFRSTSLLPPIQSLAWRNVNLAWRHDLARMEGLGGCESGESGCFGVFWPVEVTGFRISPDFVTVGGISGMFLPHDIAIVR